MYFVKSYKNQKSFQISLNLGFISPCEEDDPHEKWCVEFAASLVLAATAEMRVAFFQSCSISMKTA